jgi:hypothetical protein
VSIPRALLLALALLQAVGITDYMRRVACEEECKTDGCEDKGPCDCTACTCHCPGAPSLTETRVVVVDAPPPRDAKAIVFADADQLRASPDPREILHVPKTYGV